jgi:hypothetical protein
VKLQRSRPRIMRVQGLRTTLLALLALLTSTFGLIYEHAADLPGLQYDFVIVGGASYPFL